MVLKIIRLTIGQLILMLLMITIIAVPFSLASGIDGAGSSDTSMQENAGQWAQPSMIAEQPEEKYTIMRNRGTALQEKDQEKIEGIFGEKAAHVRLEHVVSDTGDTGTLAKVQTYYNSGKVVGKRVESETYDWKNDQGTKTVKYIDDEGNVIKSESTPFEIDLQTDYDSFKSKLKAAKRGSSSNAKFLRQLELEKDNTEVKDRVERDKKLNLKTSETMPKNNKKIKIDPDERTTP